MMFIELGACLNLKENDVVSVIGAGGKTSLILYLANYLAGKKVISASTKMYKPKENWPLYIEKPFSWCHEQEIILAAKTIIGEKMAGLNSYTLEAGFDYWLIEADGSRGLPLKGWGPNEPVIVDETRVTIGIVDITTIGMPVNEATVFRLEAFKKITGAKDKVTLQNLADMIVHKYGLFKNSKGRCILIINKAETNETIDNSQELCDRLEMTYPLHTIDRVVIGSIKNGKGYNRGRS